MPERKLSSLRGLGLQLALCLTDGTLLVLRWRGRHNTSVVHEKSAIRVRASTQNSFLVADAALTLKRSFIRLKVERGRGFRFLKELFTGIILFSALQPM